VKRTSIKLVVHFYDGVQSAPDDSVTESDHPLAFGQVQAGPPARSTAAHEHLVSGGCDPQVLASSGGDIPQAIVEPPSARMQRQRSLNSVSRQHSQDTVPCTTEQGIQSPSETHAARLVDAPSAGDPVDSHHPVTPSPSLSRANVTWLDQSPGLKAPAQRAANSPGDLMHEFKMACTLVHHRYESMQQTARNLVIDAQLDVEDFSGST
jgi:hypothetical protein